MAAKVQLDIESRANTQALKQAIADLEKLGMAGKSTNQVFGQTNNLEGYKAALVKSYETARTFGDQMKATRTAFSDTSKAIKAAQAYLGENKNNMFTFIDEKGMQQQTRDMDVIEKQIRGFLSNVISDTKNYQQSMTRQLGEFKGFDNYTKGIERTAQAYRDMGNDIGAVQYKMTAIQQQVLDMTAANADPAEIKKLTDEYKKLAAEHKELSEAANGSATRIKNLIKNFVSAQAIVYVLRKAFQMLTQGIKEASDAAAAAEQVYNKFDTVFDGLENKAAQVADTIATQYGMAGSSAREAMASIADMFVGMGVDQEEALSRAEQLTSRLSDIMAFKDIGGTIVENAQSIMSGIAGNTENFRKYGSIVKESAIQTELLKRGLSDLTGQQLEAAKATVRMDLFLQSQKNSIGATKKEWENYLSVQRRLVEESKEMKENFGEIVNTALKPFYEWLTDVIGKMNDAHAAMQNFYNNTPASAPLVDVSTDEGVQRAKNVLADFFSKQEGTYTLFGKTYGIDIKHIEAASKAFGLTAKQVLEIGLNEKTVTAEFREQVRLLDKQISQENTRNNAFKNTISQLKTFISTMSTFDSGLSSLIGGNTGLAGFDDFSTALSAELDRISKLTDSASQEKALSQLDVKMLKLMEDFDDFEGLKEFAGQDASSFASLFDKILGIDNVSGNLDSKKKALEDIITWANGVVTTSTDATIKSLAQKVLNITGDAYKKTASEIGELQRSEKILDYSQQFEDLTERNRLMKLYGEENSDVVDILMQQRDAVRQVNEFIDKQVNDGLLLAVDAESERKKIADEVARLFGLQLDNLKEQTAELKRQKAVEAVQGAQKTLAQARTTLSLVGASEYDVQMSELNQQVVEYAKNLADAGTDQRAITALVKAYREVLLQTIDAQNKYNSILKQQEAFKKAQDSVSSGQETINTLRKSNALIGASDYQISMAGINDAVLNFADKMLKDGVDFDTVRKMSTQYRIEKEEELANTLSEEVSSYLESLFSSLGDVGMIKEWIDVYQKSFDSSYLEATSSGASEDEATSFASTAASGSLWVAIIMEFAKHLETVNEIMSIFSTAMDAIAPMVDQFLAPLLVVLDPIISNLNMLKPILTLLFPVIQSVASALVIVAGVANWLNRVVEYAIGKITFWTSSDNVSWDYVQSAWSEMGDQLSQIWEMEIDARAEYVSELTDAQQGELDAYNEMFKSGMLTLTQYNALVGKNVYGRNFDNVDIASFASGGDFITNGEQIIRVGEAGREHVQITPLNSTKYASRGNTSVSNASYSVTVNGANGDPEEIAMAVRQEFKRMERRGVRYA